jgi:hypothetical protein
MTLLLTRWFLRTGLQWLCGALLALAITAAQHYWNHPHAVGAIAHSR